MPSNPNPFRLLFLGDIVGPLGREVVAEYLKAHKAKDKIDLVVANGENTTHGHGLSHSHYEELLKGGIDVITSGNHFLNCKDIFQPSYDFSKEIRPLNFDPICPLKGTILLEVSGLRVRISNLLGRVFINLCQSSPFLALEEVLGKEEKADIHLVDFHAEATAEKRCLAEYFDGQVTAVIGTHTHVQTNDAKLLERGTFFLTDVGMNGAYDSVLGDIKASSIYRTRTGMPTPMDVPRTGKKLLNAVLLEIDRETKKVNSFTLLNEIRS